MGVRPIDAKALARRIREYMDDFLNATTRLATCRVILSMLGDEKQTPTLTQPNETPPCYQPDGDGCAYQCYDGDDEPIDKCKECPLCYSDKQRHRTTLNEPLTLEELREMNGEPVWVKRLKGLSVCDTDWAVVQFRLEPDVKHYEIRVFWPGSEYEDEPSEDDYGKTWIAYRRPPEEVLRDGKDD